METFYRCAPRPARRILLILSVILSIVFLMVCPPLALVSGWVAVMVVYLSIKSPDSFLALQQDAKAAESAAQYNKFIDALISGGVIDDETMEEDIEIDDPAPFVYTVKIHQMGKTAEKLEKACNAALNALAAVDVEIRQDAPSSYICVFSPEFPARILNDRACSYSSMVADMKDDITIKNLPVGVDVNGAPVCCSLESRNGLIAGIMGSGKSVMLSVLLCDLLRIHKGNERVIVMSPKILDFQNFEGACRLIKDNNEIMECLAELRAEMERRKEWCIQNRRKKITAAEYTKFPHITVIVDEYTVIKTSTETDDKGRIVRVGEQIEAEIMRLVAEARFAAISFVIALQKADSRNIDTRTRDLISGVKASFAAEGRTSAEMVFGDYAEFTPCHELSGMPGVGYIQIDSEKPIIFKGAFADDSDELAAAAIHTGGGVYDD